MYLQNTKARSHDRINKGVIYSIFVQKYSAVKCQNKHKLPRIGIDTILNHLDSIIEDGCPLLNRIYRLQLKTHQQPYSCIHSLGCLQLA